MKKLLFICVTLVSISLSWAAATPNGTEQSTAPTTIAVTTLSPEEECKKHSTSCDDCVGVANAQCVYCQSKKQCKLKKSVIPIDECALSDAKWGVCWVNYEALIIAVSVIGSLIILGIFICCCCCCRGKGKEKLKIWEAKWERDKAERKAKNDERRAERQQKTDEIRRKYVVKLANRFLDLSHEDKETLEDEVQAYILSPSQELPPWGEHSLEEYWKVVTTLQNPATGKLKFFAG